MPTEVWAGRRGSEVAMARGEMAAMLQHLILYRDEGGRRLYALRSTEETPEGWHLMSTPDLSQFLGVKDHSALVYSLQRWRARQAELRKAMEARREEESEPQPT